MDYIHLGIDFKALKPLEVAQRLWRQTRFGEESHSSLSAQAYNMLADYRHLADAIRKLTAN
jgi:hypothetical protein